MWTDIWQLELLNSFLEDLWGLRRALTLCSLDHISLPCHCSGCRVIVVLQVLPLLFSCLGFSVAMNALQLLFPGVPSSSFVRYHIVVVILPVHRGILDRRISHVHEIVTADGSEDDIGGYLWLELDDTQQKGISVGQDTKSVLADSSAMASSIVIDPFWDLQAQSAISFHNVGVQREVIVTNKEIGSISIIIRQVVRRQESNNMLVNCLL